MLARFMRNNGLPAAVVSCCSVLGLLIGGCRQSARPSPFGEPDAAVAAPSSIRSASRTVPAQTNSTARRRKAARPKTTVRSAFASLEDCNSLLDAGQRANRVPNTVRLGTWNLRWFPDGIPGAGSPSARTTDLTWLGCVLAWLDVDAVALSEIKHEKRSAPALQALIQEVNRRTGGDYTVQLDGCPASSGQHVGWLVNRRVLAITEWVEHGELNPQGEACAQQLRPGLGVSLRSRQGLDFHAVSVHLKSGTTPRDLGLRQASLVALEGIVRSTIERTGDADLIVAGDFNSMGCGSCPPWTGSAAEGHWMDGRLSNYQPPLRRVPSDLGCSHYYRGEAAQLDQFVVTSNMAEVPRKTLVEVEGTCRDRRCAEGPRRPGLAERRLSDHCPIVLSILDRDED